MFRSKVIAVSRHFCKVKPETGRQFSTTASRRGGDMKWFYRENPVPDGKEVIAAEVMGGFMWWWILWHTFTDYGHIIGEFEFPDVSSFTDEELGIPPDSED